MNILSLFDGMSCGQIAFKQLGIDIDNYYAYEIDKFAIENTLYNFPNTKQLGDVFKADFTQYKDIDFLVGGSPCTYWSIAQSVDKRETTASGIGWELFSQYVRALKESKPKYFIYENNKSMSDDIRKSITDTFGFEPILINSALVSAQNRERLYWVGELNADGYNRVNVCQPEDMNITVSDILDTVGVVLKYERSEQGKQLRKDYENGKIHHGFNEYRNLVPRTDGKSNTVSTVSKDNQIIEPICVALRGRYDDTGNRYKKGNEKVTQYVEARGNKSNTLTTVSKDNMIAEPIYSVPINTNDYNKSMCMCAGYYKSGMFDIIANITQKRTGVAEIVDFDVDSNTIIKLDDKEYKVYEVKNGNITYNNKTYPIKLADGNYIIRRLSVSECMKLQTVPDWYKWSVSNSQALKMLGNGWTVNVICHLINSCLDTSIREKVIKKHKLF
jgi:DNA (cytosine-5)-methyltransferase 3A